MSIDYSVHLECDVKAQLGDGDAMAGEGDLLRRLQANGRVKVLQKVAKEQGKDVQTMRATINEVDDDGQPVRYEVGYADLLAEVKPLAALQSACADCPANALQRPFGCQGALKYPIRSQAEQWLMDQVQTFDTVAGPYLVAACDDGDEGLAMIRAMRGDGLFGSPRPIGKVIGGRQAPGAEIDSDSVFELFLGRGDALEPGYGLMILLGLAAIRLDGQPATSAEAFGALIEMDDVADRRRRTSFAFAPSPDAEIVGLQSLLRAMYFAWRNEVLFLVSV